MAMRQQPTYGENALYEYGVKALARRMRSVAELKRLLRRKVAAQAEGEALVEAVVARLKEHRYLNDTEYAAAYTGYRRENEKLGRLRVVRDLKSKGVHGEIIEKTVNAAYADVNEEHLARQFLARKRVSRPADEKQAARVFRLLFRAGFSSQTIFAILKHWEVADEVVEALAEIGDDDDGLHEE